MNEAEEFIKCVKDGDIDKISQYYKKEYLEKEDDLKKRPIHWAVQCNRDKILNFLLQEGCSIECVDKFGWRPIHIVSDEGHLELLKVLIGKNCDLECKTMHKMSPLELAKRKKNNDCMNILSGAIHNKKIALSMGLKCNTECDHKFCLKSFLLSDFKKGNLIESGSYGAVHKLIESGTKREFVVKKILLNFSQNNQDKDIENKNKNFEDDMNKYTALISHPRIVRYFGAIHKQNKIKIFMEFVNGGTLEAKIQANGPLSRQMICRLTKQILEGLKFLHQNKIIHRDVKPANILLDHESNIKLSDFGFSRLLETFQDSSNGITVSEIVPAKTFCGTQNYMAPEILNGDQYGFPCDIWSLGATVIEMLTGKRPFENVNPIEILNKIKNDNTIKFVKPEYMSEEMQTFVEKMIHLNPSERSTAETLLEGDLMKNCNEH